MAIVNSAKAISWTGIIKENDYTFNVQSSTLGTDTKKVSTCNISIQKSGDYVGNYNKSVNNTDFNILSKYDADSNNIFTLVQTVISEIEAACA